jgi:hypothetical protein
MTEAPLDAKQFAYVDHVVVDPLRLKLKLGVGADAYASLMIGDRVGLIGQVGGAAAIGAGVATTAPVAAAVGTTGGFWAALGIGATAVTPVGWIVGAALASGSLTYGIIRLYRGLSESRVAVIPKFLSTPVDIMGAAVFDALAPLAIKVVSFGEAVDDDERSAITEYFAEEWGLDRTYVRSALPIIEAQVQSVRLEMLARDLARLLKANPDCNFAAVERELHVFLDEVAQVDGQVSEPEVLAIEKIMSTMHSERPSLLRSLASRIADAPFRLGRHTLRSITRRDGCS